jgi:hypothetical protein
VSLPAALNVRSLEGLSTFWRICVGAALRFKAEGEDQEKTQYGMLIAIDPATGKWQKIADDAHSGRVSPDGKTLVFNRLDDGWP